MYVSVLQIKSIRVMNFAKTCVYLLLQDMADKNQRIGLQMGTKRDQMQPPGKLCATEITKWAF
jgi:hypothetical protein